MSILHHINSFWASYGEWITIALIPTIIAGLTISPRTQKAAGMVPKIWDAVKLVMGFLSVLTHKDQTGTFKLPLKPAVPKKDTVSTDAGPAAVLVFVIIFSSVSTQPGCAWWGKNKDKVQETVVNCSIVAVRDAAMELLPAVLAILTGGSVKWGEQLNAFAKTFGQDAVACALEIASAQVLASQEYGTGPEAMDKRLDAVNKARQYKDVNNIVIQPSE